MGPLIAAEIQDILNSQGNLARDTARRGWGLRVFMTIIPRIITRHFGRAAAGPRTLA